MEIEIDVRERLGEVFRKTGLYNNDSRNDNLKYQSFRDSKRIYNEGMRHMLEIIEENIYTDFNTGQICFKDGFDLEDIIF
mgnify:CR=1 FL=1